jgi:endonuclease/exonuclease/phosphatase family metal-dependent hydrolase
MSLRIATFNLQHGRGPDGVVEPGRLANALAALDADVLGIQEVDVGVRRSGGVDQAALAAAATGMRVAFGAAIRVRVRGLYGNALLVRGDMWDVELLRMPRPRAGERRAALLARVAVGDRELSVACTHLAVEREEAQRQLDVVVAALARRPEPRVLLGDCNLGAEFVGPVVEAAGMTLAPGPPTYPAWSPQSRIDHVAVAGLDIVSVVTPESAVSDHRPLVAEVS